MAYQLKRAQKITESLELVDDNGNVVDTLLIDVNPDAIMAQYVKAQTAVTQAKIALAKEYSDEKAKACGDAIITVMRIIFGDENAEKLLVFYEHREAELLECVWPFLMQVIHPKLREASKEKANRLRNLTKPVGRK